MTSLAPLVAVLRGEQPTPACRTLTYSGPVDADTMSALAEGLASNMLVHGLRLEGASRVVQSAAVTSCSQPNAFRIPKPSTYKFPSVKRYRQYGIFCYHGIR